MAKVYAANDTIKRLIFHPAVKQPFGEDGSANWPDDQFTQRRVRDGDVTLEPPGHVEHRTTAARRNAERQ